MFSYLAKSSCENSTDTDVRATLHMTSTTVSVADFLSKAQPTVFVADAIFSSARSAVFSKATPATLAPSCAWVFNILKLK